MALNITHELSAPVTTAARLVTSQAKRKKTLGVTLRQATVRIGAGDETVTVDAYIILRRADVAMDARGLPGTVREALTNGLVSVHTSIAGRLSPSLAERVIMHVEAAALTAADKRTALEGAYARLVKGIPATTEQADTPTASPTAARDKALAMLDEDPSRTDEEFAADLKDLTEDLRDDATA